MENEDSAPEVYLTAEEAAKEVGANNLLTFDKWVKRFRVPATEPLWNVLIHEYGYHVWSANEPYESEHGRVHYKLSVIQEFKNSHGDMGRELNVGLTSPLLPTKKSNSTGPVSSEEPDFEQERIDKFINEVWEESLSGWGGQSESAEGGGRKVRHLLHD